MKLQEVVHPQRPENRAFDRPDLMPTLVVEQPRSGELEVCAAGDQLAPTSRKDVLHPVRVRTVGQRQDVAATRTREHVYRRPVLLAGRASAMDHDAEPGQPWRQLAGELVQRGLVDLAHPPVSYTH